MKKIIGYKGYPNLNAWFIHVELKIIFIVIFSFSILSCQQSASDKNNSIFVISKEILQTSDSLIHNISLEEETLTVNIEKIKDQLDPKLIRRSIKAGFLKQSDFINTLRELVLDHYEINHKDPPSGGIFKCADQYRANSLDITNHFIEMLSYSPLTESIIELSIAFNINEREFEKCLSKI